MKTFSDFLTEEMISFSAFNIARSNMPQIINIEGFLKFVDTVGVQHTKDIREVDYLRPTQNEYKENKVKKITYMMQADNYDPTQLKPIIVSSDNFVLDGHHRYFAAIAASKPIPVITIDLMVNQLLKLAINYTEL